MSFDIPHQMRQLASSLNLLKKANNCFTNFWHSEDMSNILPILQKMQNITIIYEKCLSGSSKVHVAKRKILQVRYLTYGWLFYIKYIYPHPKNDNKIGPKCKISSECSLSQNNKKHYNNIFS